MAEGTLANLSQQQWLIADPTVDVRDIALPDGRELRVLRDDLTHPLVGGNKLRKLDGVLPDLHAQGVTDVLTCGGVQSSHATAVAVACAELGVRSHVLLRGEQPEVPTGYTLLTQVYAHSTTFVSRGAYTDRRRMFETHARRIESTLTAAGLRPRLAIVPEGATSVAGLRGLVRLVAALADALGPRAATLPHILVVDSGTGTTATGLALGCALQGLPWQVHGVMLMPESLERYQRTAQRLVRGWEQTYGPVVLSGSRLRWVRRTPERRFGKLIDSEIARCVGISRSTGMPIDPIYTLAAWDYCVRLPDAHLDLAVMIHTGGSLNMMGVAQRKPSMPGLPTGDVRATEGRGMPMAARLPERESSRPPGQPDATDADTESEQSPRMLDPAAFVASDVGAGEDDIIRSFWDAAMNARTDKAQKDAAQKDAAQPDAPPRSHIPATGDAPAADRPPTVTDRGTAADVDAGARTHRRSETPSPPPPSVVPVAPVSIAPTSAPSPTPSSDRRLRERRDDDVTRPALPSLRNLERDADAEEAASKTPRDGDALDEDVVARLEAVLKSGDLPVVD